VFRGIELLVGAEDYEVIDAMSDDGGISFFGIEVKFDDDEDDDDNHKKKRK
jgi:hypothetical protein